MISYDDSLASNLNQRAQIWKNGTSATKDALGQYPQEDQPVATVWAGVIPQTGSLLTGRTAETMLTKTTHKIILRYRTDLTPDMWLTVGGVRYDILYILDPYLRHERLEVFCEVRFDGS